MPYIGKQIGIGNYQVLDAITATTTATYALTKNSVAVYPQTPANCIVSLNGVIQAPFDSYTISGSNIVFASALTASDSIDFITVLGDVLNVGTVSDGTIGISKLSATGTPSSSTFLRGDNSWVSAGGTNTPAFLATPSSTQTISNTTFTKILFQTEVLDTDSAYDASNSTFTVPSGKGGIYIFYHNMRMPLSDGEERTHFINVNGSNDLKSGVQFYPGNNAPFYSTVTQMLNLSAGDVIYQNVYVTSSGTRTTITDYTYFGGYKLIGV